MSSTIGVIQIDSTNSAQLIVGGDGYVRYWANSSMTGYPRGQVVYIVQ